jgi:hypothetical protein
MGAVRFTTCVAGLDTGNGDRQYSGDEGDVLTLSDETEAELVKLGWAVSISGTASAKPKPASKAKKD